MKKIFKTLMLGGIVLTSCGNLSSGDNISSSPNVEMNSTFYNPLDIKKGIGDPWLYKHTDGYYYYTHSGSGGIKVSKTKSPTFLKED